MPKSQYLKFPIYLPSFLFWLCLTKKSFYFYLCVYANVYVKKWRCQKMPEEGAGSPGAEVKGESVDMGVGTEFRSLEKYVMSER